VRNLRHANVRVGEQGLGSLDVVIGEFWRTTSGAVPKLLIYGAPIKTGKE
jgi:hypothetical protein